MTTFSGVPAKSPIRTVSIAANDLASGSEVSPANFIQTDRNVGLDALRAFTTLLVVFHHCAITYGAIGGWYYHEVAPSRDVATICLVLFCTVNQAFFMGLFFLLAGYYSRSSLARKGLPQFLFDRFFRLGLPLLFYGVVLGPITIALAQTSKGLPFGATLRTLVSRGTFDSGPMWFAQALLIFTLLLAVGMALLRYVGHPVRVREVSFPTNLTLGVGALLTAAAAFILRIRWPVGVNVWDLQLGYFASYVVLFAAGFAAARGRRLEFLPARQVKFWSLVSLVTLPILPFAYYLSGASPKSHHDTMHIVYALWEPFVAWGIILFLLRFFQRNFSRLGHLMRRLSRRAYTIYILHPPILVAIALSWSSVHANPLVKFGVTGALSCVACYLIAGVVLKVPGMRGFL
ncbi:acyltransferase family protein [Paraburkholderia sp. JPY419]|uniref:acyltransferase family protein n=1 Tax=Paraburkholderia sp. JPY419 TaxID=667660 RepID=UPI003D1F8AA5